MALPSLFRVCSEAGLPSLVLCEGFVAESREREREEKENVWVVRNVFGAEMKVFYFRSFLKLLVGFSS